jgi:hypothetical protein
VTIVEALGAESFAHGKLGGAPFVARLDAGRALKKGETVEPVGSSRCTSSIGRRALSLRADGAMRGAVRAFVAVSSRLSRRSSSRWLCVAAAPQARPSLWHAYRGDEEKALARS